MKQKRFHLVNYAFGHKSFKEVSESEFLEAKNIEADTYIQGGYSISFSEIFNRNDQITDIYFNYLNDIEEGSFLFGFISKLN